MEVTALTQDGDGPVQVDVTDRVHGTSDDAAGRLRARLRRRQQHRPHRDRRAHGRPEVRPALARRRRGHRGRTGRVGRRAPGVRHPPRRDLHAHRRHPLPVGVPTRPHRDRRRLPRHHPPAPAHRAVDQVDTARPAAHRARGRVHLPRPDRRPLARPADLPARRRRAPHPAVHRPGHGRRAARRGQPRLETRRRPVRRPPRPPRGHLPGHLRGRTQAARPRHDPAGEADRNGHDRRRRAREAGAPAGRAPPASPARRQATTSWTAAHRRCGAPPWSPDPACVEHRPGSCARTPPSTPPTAFDDLAAGRFALVTTIAPTPAQQCEIERRGAVVITAAPGSDLHRWLRRGRARAALVRPDGTVQRTGPGARTAPQRPDPARGPRPGCDGRCRRPRWPPPPPLRRTRHDQPRGPPFATGAAATAVAQPDERCRSGTDAAAPLDLLLADGARGLLRRFAPAGPGLRWAVDLASRPKTVVQRAAGPVRRAGADRDRPIRGRARRTGSPLPRRRLAHQPDAAADPAGLPGGRGHGPRVARRRPPRLARPRPPGVRPRQPRRRPRPEQQPAHQPDRVESADRLRRR